MSLPDFVADETTVQKVVHALRTNGCCAIRSLIPTTLLDGIRKRVEEEYAVMDENYNNGNMTEEEYRHCYRYGILRPFEQNYQLGEWSTHVRCDDQLHFKDHAQRCVLSIFWRRSTQYVGSFFSCKTCSTRRSRSISSRFIGYEIT